MWERRLRLGHLRIFAVRLVLEVDCDEMRKGENGDRNVFPSSTHFPPPSYHGYNVCKSIHTQNRMAFPFFPISKPRFSPKTLNGIFALEDQEGLSAHLVMWGDRTNTPLPFVISHCVWVLHLLRKKKRNVVYWKRKRLRGSVAHEAIWFVFFCKLDVWASDISA